LVHSLIKSLALNRVKRIVLVLTVIGITSSLLLMFAAYVFEDEIIASAKSAINEKVDTPIDVDQIQFSFLKDFPRASLIFKNVRIQDKFDENKDLLAVEQVSLQFNALGLLSQNYDINRATLNQGVLNMYVTEEGLENFIFWNLMKIYFIELGLI